MTSEQGQAIQLLEMEVIQTGGILRHTPLGYYPHAPMKVEIEFQDAHHGPTEPPVLVVTRLVLASGTVI